MPRAFCPKCGAEVPVDEHGTCHVGHTVDLAAATTDDDADLAADAATERPEDATDTGAEAAIADADAAEDEPQPWVLEVDDEDAAAQDDGPMASEPSTAVPEDAVQSPKPDEGADAVDLDAVEAAVAELEESGTAGDVEIGAPEDYEGEDAGEYHDEWLAPFSEGGDTVDDTVDDIDVPTWDGLEPDGEPAGQEPAARPEEGPDAEAGTKTDEEQPAADEPPPGEPDEQSVAAEASAEVTEETEDEPDEEPVTPREVGVDPTNFTARGERVGDDTRWSLLDLFRR